MPEELVHSEITGEHLVQRRRNSRAFITQPDTALGYQGESSLNTQRALSNLEITDLLEKSLIQGPIGREQNKLRQVVELYKRQVKKDRELLNKPELMIKNYRLYLVKNPTQELDPYTRSLLTLNKGTSISVSNSIMKPEIHKFGTSVTGRLADLFPLLKEEF